MSEDAVTLFEQRVQSAKEDVNQANVDLLEAYKKYVSSHESLYKETKKMWSKLAKTDPLSAGEQLADCLTVNQKPIEELYTEAVHKRDYKAGHYNTLVKRLKNMGSQPSTHTGNNDDLESLPPPDYDQLYPTECSDSGLENAWNDLCLSKKVRNQLNLLLANRFSKEAVDLAINIPVDFVIYGSPGNGKTTLAKLICETLPIEWIYKDAGQELALTRTTSVDTVIRAIFEEANAKAVQTHQYCAVVLDNMESIQASQQNRIMATLRAQLDSDNHRSGGKKVMFIGVTSYIEIFDSTFLTRDSIIEKVVYIDLPNHQERKEILRKALQKMHPKHLDQSPEALPGLCEKFAGLTLTYTRDNLVNGLLKTAESLALKDGMPLDSEHMIQASRIYRRTCLPKEERRKYDRNRDALARGTCDFKTTLTGHDLLAAGAASNGQ
uniref:AAA+ ATPase domain-containing protein n=1 Tax=Ditylenchus dipsaci TaxID=166011 RepID=A0A915DGY8_9BILA